MWWWETRGVHGLEPWDVFLGQERVLQRLDKVEVLNSALWTGNCLTVVREEVESLFRVNDELSTGVALQKQVSPKNISHTCKKYLPWACRRSRGPRRRCRSCTWCPGSTGSRPRPCHSWSSCTGAWRSIPPDSPYRQQRGNKHDPRPLPRHRYYRYVFSEQPHLIKWRQ